MHCIARDVGDNCYDVIVWDNFTDSIRYKLFKYIDDPEVRAVNRRIIFVPEDEEFITDYIRAAMDLTVSDSIDLE